MKTVINKWKECKINPKNWSESFVGALVGTALAAATLVVAVGAITLEMHLQG